jgi:hypothetical protein
VHQLPFQLLIRQRGYSPVGSAGLEPAASRLSDERSYPVSYEPAEDGGVDPHGLWPPQAFKARCRAGGASSILERRAADSNRNACTPIRFRGGAHSPGGFTLHEQIPRPV